MTPNLTAASHRRRTPRAIAFLVAAIVVAGSTVALSAFKGSRDGARATVASGAPDGGAGNGAAGGGTSGGVSTVPALGSIAQIDHSIAAWTANLAADPHDFISATNLATLYHARGRVTGDLDDQTRALEAARTAERIAPRETAAATLEAGILYTLHDFGGSLVIADRLVRANPADLGSLAIRADDELELGQIADAQADYATLAATASGPAIQVRLARVAYITGAPAEALALAQAALDQAAADPEADLGFYDFAVGEYARLLGQKDVARAAYDAALGVRDTDFASIVGLAKVDAAGGDVTRAIDGLERAAAIVPQPETLTLLGDLRMMAGDTHGADAAYATVRAIRQLSEIEGSVFDRQLALFDLDHGGATTAILVAAVAGLDNRTDAAGYDLAAWAAYRMDRFTDAARYSDLAMAGGIRDARILEHAGAIARANGDRVGGDDLLRAALALGPALDPLATAEAQRLIGN